jgi:hypothetical protein
VLVTNDWVWRVGGMTLIGKPNHLGKNLCQCHFVQCKSHMDRFGIDPHLCIERLATNHLSCCAASEPSLFSSHQRCEKLLHTPNKILFTSLASAKWQGYSFFEGALVTLKLLCPSMCMKLENCWVDFPWNLIFTSMTKALRRAPILSETGQQ